MNLFYDKKKSIIWFKILGFLFLILIVFYLNYSSENIRNSFYYISKPILNAFSNYGKNTSGVVFSILNINNIQKENQELKEHNQKLISQISYLQDVSDRDRAVKEILLNSSQDNFNLLLSNITGVDLKNDFILIDKGRDDGVLENMAVISQEKVLFGKVFKVYKNFSQVMLISNKNSVLDIKIQKQNDLQENNLDAKDVYGAIKGSGGLSLYLDMIPIDKDIKTGEVLITSGLDGVFPKNLLVGKVKEVIKNDLKTFQTAKIDSFFEIKEISNLFIITSHNQEY